MTHPYRHSSEAGAWPQPSGALPVSPSVIDTFKHTGHSGCTIHFIMYFNNRQIQSTDWASQQLRKLIQRRINVRLTVHSQRPTQHTHTERGQREALNHKILSGCREIAATKVQKHICTGMQYMLCTQDSIHSL